MQQPKQTRSAYLDDEAATQALGGAMARALAPGLVIYLHGDPGAGKTALTRALLQAAGHQGAVKSPTYTLSEPYRITLGGQNVNLIHYDLYRMSSPEEFLDAGFREDFDGSNICSGRMAGKGRASVAATRRPACCLRSAATDVSGELQALSDRPAMPRPPGTCPPTP